MIDITDVVFLPLTVSTYKDRQDAILSTWGKRIVNLDWLDWENGFGHIPIDLIKYIAGTLEKQIDLSHQWYVFCDDDTYIFVDRLMDVLDTHDHEDLVCIGSIINCLPGRSDLLYPSGVCFALSHASIMALRAYFIANEDPPRHFNHDSSMGEWCAATGVAMVNVAGLYGTSHVKLGHAPAIIQQSIAYNHIGPEMMQGLEQYNDVP